MLKQCRIADEIFLHACELRGAARRDYIARACGNDHSLRAEVEKLLGADELIAQGRLDTKLADAFAQLAPPEHASLPERIGHYRIEKQIGAGTYGRVYAAFDENLHRRVAIKVPRPKRVANSQQFHKEARNLAQLRHPHIVTVFDFGTTEDGLCYVVCEFVAGGGLDARLKSARFDQLAAARLVAKIARALQHAHGQGVYHRDVKPANILLNSSDEPVLADFGLAMTEQDWGLGHEIIGTPAYMSPEQARGEGHRVDGRSDLFSLGVVLYELLTGRRPFVGCDAVDTLLRIQSKAPQPPREIDASILPQLQCICLRALAKRPADRYPTGHDLAHDLEQLLAASPAEPSAAKPWATTQDIQPTLGPADATLRTSAGVTLGEFELQSVIGSGGMAVVYRARQAKLGRDVALKCVRLGNAKWETRFRREIQALGAVKHPHLVAIHASGWADGQSYYAMELIDGADLTAVCQQLTRCGSDRFDDETWKSAVTEACHEMQSHERTLCEPALDDTGVTLSGAEELALQRGDSQLCQSRAYVRRMAMIIGQIAAAAEALHGAGIVHRDIKPSNIMVTRDGDHAVLIDPGIARLADDEENSLTMTREVVGTLRYASPEQVLAVGTVDHRSDVYSLGATLWELLALRPMFADGDEITRKQLMHKIEVEEPPPVGKHNRAVPAGLEAVVQKCLEKNPARRYPTAAALAEDLDRFLRGEPVTARPVGVVRRGWQVLRRRRGAVLSTAAAMLIVLGAVFLRAAIDSGQPAPPPRDPNTLVVGVKAWVGYSPLAVARDLDLCHPYKLKFERVVEIDDAIAKMNKGEIDVMMCPVEGLLIARSEGCPVRAILQADSSYEADAVVARRAMEFSELAGKRVAYVQKDAPHFLLMALCEEHGLAMKDLKAEAFLTPADALAAFNDSSKQFDAAVIFAPYLQQASGGHVIAKSGDRDSTEPPRVVDVLAVHERCLTSANRPKIAALVSAWCSAVDRLQARDPAAIESARRFLEEVTGEPKSQEQYFTAADRMEYSGSEDNAKFFDKGGSTPGESEFGRRIRQAYPRLQSHQLIKVELENLEKVDGSGPFLPIFTRHSRFLD